MMSPETIRSLEEKAARRAAKRKMIPYMPWDIAEVEAWGSDGVSAPLPSIGGYKPKGWQRVDGIDELFVDASGWGREDEPAMTLKAFKRLVIENIRAGKQYGYAITSVGQFQIYIGIFEQTEPGPRTRKPRQKKLARKEGMGAFSVELNHPDFPEKKDPMAFMMGFLEGVNGQPRAVDGPGEAKLATAYKRGWKFGQAVAQDKAAVPVWVNKR